MTRSTFISRVNPFLVLILLGILILRIPNLFEPYWYGDEGIYLTIGEGLRQGELLYRDIFDHKPPAIYVLAAISGSLAAFKFSLLIFHLITVVLFWKLAQKVFKESTIAQKDYLPALKLSTFVFAIFTTLPILEGHIANAELFMALPTLAGLLLIWPLGEQSIKRTFWGGVAFSLAFLFKVPAFFDAAAPVFFWFASSFGKWREFFSYFKRTFILGIGFVIPIIITAIYFIVKGAWGFFLEGTLGQNISYVGSWATPQVSTGSATFLSGGLNFRAVILVAFLFAFFIFKKFIDRPTFFICIWLVLSIFAMLLSGRPYPHYVIQALAPASIALALLFYGAQKYRFWTVPALLLLFLSLNFYNFFYYPILPYYSNFIKRATGQITTDEYFRNFDSRVPTTYKVAKYLVERTTSKDRVFIWGTEPELYSLARRVPPGRYTTSFHIVDFNGQEETLKSLQDNPPRYIIRMETEKRDFPGFNNFLQNNYVYVQNIDSAQIWRLVDPKLVKYFFN